MHGVSSQTPLGQNVWVLYSFSLSVVTLAV